MRKLLSVVLCLCMFTPLSITAYATSTSQQNVLTDEVLLSLTDEDFSDCFDYLLQYASQNQSCTSETLDNLALEFYAQRYREKVDTPSPQDSFYDDWSSLNSEELALGKNTHPTWPLLLLPKILLPANRSADIGAAHI